VLGLAVISPLYAANVVRRRATAAYAVLAVVVAVMLGIYNDQYTPASMTAQVIRLVGLVLGVWWRSWRAGSGYVGRPSWPPVSSGGGRVARPSGWPRFCSAACSRIRGRWRTLTSGAGIGLLLGTPRLVVTGSKRFRCTTLWGSTSQPDLSSWPAAIGVLQLPDMIMDGSLRLLYRGSSSKNSAATSAAAGHLALAEDRIDVVPHGVQGKHSSAAMSAVGTPRASG